MNIKVSKCFKIKLIELFECTRNLRTLICVCYLYIVKYH